MWTLRASNQRKTSQNKPILSSLTSFILLFDVLRDILNQTIHERRERDVNFQPSNLLARLFSCLWLSFDAKFSSFSLAESPPRDRQITCYGLVMRNVVQLLRMSQTRKHWSPKGCVVWQKAVRCVKLVKPSLPVSVFPLSGVGCGYT